MDEERLICPHCGQEQYNHVPDEISAFMCHTKCESCGAPFWYAVTVTRTYSSYIEDEPGGEGEDDDD